MRPICWNPYYLDPSNDTPIFGRPPDTEDLRLRAGLRKVLGVHVLGRSLSAIVGFGVPGSGSRLQGSLRAIGVQLYAFQAYSFSFTLGIQIAQCR